MFDDNLCSRGCFLVLFIGLFSSVSFNQMHVKRDTRAAAAALFVGGRRDNHSDRVCGRVPQAEQGVHRGGHPPPPHHQGLQESHQTGKQHSTRNSVLDFLLGMCRNYYPAGNSGRNRKFSGSGIRPEQE